MLIQRKLNQKLNQMISQKISIVFLCSFLLTSQSFAADSIDNQIQTLAQIENYDDFDDDDFDDFNFQVTPTKEIYDPFEKVNRKIFIFNDFVDRHLFEHIALGYRKVLPGFTRRSIRNFLSNLYSPFTVVNSILQGNLDNSMASFSSFLINSTLGIGGLFDVAGSKDITYFEEDLGQTFASYGLGPGPYLMLPFLGPSNLRDSSGMAITTTIDPLSVNIFKVGDDVLFDDEVLMGLTVISMIDKRESLLKIISDLRTNSFDIYATARSAYMQNRQSKINNEN